MIDFSGKIIWVKDSEEADCLLKMAISQGYKPCIGEKAMTVSKLFSFTGDHVIRPCTEVCLDKMESFRELLRENDFVQLASGQSVTVFKQILQNLGYNPVEAMENTINSERYDCITVEGE